MLNSKRVPVFIVNGFLESGKTTFIINAILRDPNAQKERFLIVCCEEGEIEYEDLPENIDIYPIDDKEDLTEDIFESICKFYDPTYVIIEYNGVWGMQALYSTRMPAKWGPSQQITIINANTFKEYYSNMKSIFSDMLRSSARVFMNRCTREDDFKFFKDSIKRNAPSAEIMYMSDEEGMMNIILEDELPYDLKSDVISLNKDSYLIWYIDMMDNVERYVGKKIEYIGVVAKPPYLAAGHVVIGNEVMTCCEDDMQFLGYVCKCDDSDALKEGNTVKIQAEVHFEHAPEYEGKGPVLYITKTTSMTASKHKKKK